MKKSIILLLVPLLLSGCILPEKAKEPSLEQLTRVDVVDEEYTNYDFIFGEEEEINELIELFKKIEWEDGKAEMAREPDVILNLFFTVEKDMSESIRPYQVWFNSDQTATFIDSHNARIGKLKKKHATKLRELINEKLERVMDGESG